MKIMKAHPVHLALIGGIALLTNATFAQTWQTVDSFQYVPGQTTLNCGLTVAPSGVVYACGFGSDGTNDYHGLIVASMDSGNSWSSPIDDFSLADGGARYNGGIAADTAGNLFVSGIVDIDSGGFLLDFYQVVRRSADGGLTWQTADSVRLPNYSLSLAAGGIATDGAGNVYHVVNAANGWVIRKGVNGLSFSTVDSVVGAEARAVLAHPTAGVFAVGYGTVTSRKSSSQAWIVRRSLDGGATWATVDSYQSSSGYAADACGVGADAHGNVYVMGRAAAPYKGGAINHWITRKSANGGASWSTMDDYQLFTSGNQVALGFAADSIGNLFVAGWASVGTSTGPYHWLVRKSVGGNGAFTTVDDYSDVSGAMPKAIAADDAGHVFVGGQGSPASGSVHWIVRRN
jgi:hypothetical protein